MIDLLSTKVSSGDLYIRLATQYLGNHEWGRARRAVEEGFAKGGLSEPGRAARLLREIQDRLCLD